jgi:hypothetical protein
MAAQVNRTCPQHPDPDMCPDKLVAYTPRFNEYGLLIHDGGTSFIVIRYCPWCGKELPRSVRNDFFDRMDQLGIDYPDEAPPSECADSTWWEREQRRD